MMARDPRLDIQVAYCSLRGAELSLDPGFGQELAWDIPLLEGYPWREVANRALRPGVERFFGLVNPGLYGLVRSGGFDAVVSFTGYMYLSFWIVVAAVKLGKLPLLFGTDAHELRPRDGRAWKAVVKRWLWPRLFGLADTVLVTSSGGERLMRSLGFPAERVISMLFVVDNKRWIEASARADRTATRARWGIPVDAPVVLFSGKLQPWKRPEDLLRAFARAQMRSAHLVFAGDGALRVALEAEARSLQLEKQAHFLGFVNQSALPEVYTAADLLVVPSHYEPFGVVVNEAMLCGRPVVVSDHVGARFDLVREGRTGFVYPCGDVDRLATILRELPGNPERFRAMGQAALAQMADWSPEKAIDAFVEAVQRAIERRSLRRAKAQQTAPARGQREQMR